MAVDQKPHNALMELEEALERILVSVKAKQDYETVSLTHALDRVLACDVIAPIHVPPSDNSAMDGYAVRSRALAEEGPITLPVTQRIAAGHVGEAMQAETAARIFTGAATPEGVDAVIMQENCTESDGTVHFQGPIKLGDNIRRAGESVTKGDVILTKGTKLGPAHIGLAASVGIASFQVYHPLRVAVLSTGDELREPGDPLDAGQIYNTNHYALFALLEKLSCKIVDLGTVKDDPALTKAALERASKEADLVLTSGGVSVGEEDHVKDAILALGSLDLWKLNIKPGKPLAFGWLGEVPFIGLPGNPVSAYVTFLLVAAPLIRKMQGRSDLISKASHLALGFDQGKRGKRREYIRVQVHTDADKGHQLIPYPSQGSGILSSIFWADGLALLPDGVLCKKGDLVDYLSFEALLG